MGKASPSFRIRISVVLTICVLVFAVVEFCFSGTSSPPVFHSAQPKGLDFVLQNSPTSQKYLIETMPGGVALLDYNNDGLLDIFFVNGGQVTSPMRQPENFGRHDPRYWNRLYR